MKILVIGKFCAEGFALHIAETLVGMGHAVKRFDLTIELSPAGGRIAHRLNQIRGFVHAASDAVPSIRARRMRSLWHLVDEGPLDAVIICHDFLWPNEVTELKRRSGAAVAMWFPDHLANFGKGFFMNAPYDALFFKDPYIIHTLSSVVKSPVLYLPECFNPERHRLPEGEIPGEQYRCEVTTAGNSHSWRVAAYKHLDAYDVKLWGAPAPLWMPTGLRASMHQGRSVLNEDKARAFLGAKIVLNNLHYGEIWGLNARAFEAAGIGAFQMVDWRPGLSQLFEDGKEIVSFRSVDDMNSRIDYWLARPDERAEVARAGKRRAHAEHTYRMRLSLLLDSLGQRATGFPLPNIGWAESAVPSR